MIDAEAEEGVSVRGDDPPALVFLDAEVASGVELFARPSAIAVGLRGSVEVGKGGC